MMESDDLLTYGDLSIGRKLRSTQTGEHAEIISLGNGLVEIELTDGPDRGEDVTLTPQELSTWWRKE